MIINIILLNLQQAIQTQISNQTPTHTLIKSHNQSYFPSLDYNKIKTFHSLHMPTKSTNQITTKQSVLLKKLSSKLINLTQFMQTQGMSTHDITHFILRSVFQVSCSQVTLKPKLSKDFNSETEEQTNSEASEWNQIQISLQKVLIQKVTDGYKIDKLLLGYLEQCCIEQDKLKTYLKSEQIQDTQKQPQANFQQFKQKLTLTKHRKHRYQSTSLFQSPQLLSNTSHISSIRQRIQQVKQRSVVEDSERQLEYMRSFEKSLSQSIRKTKLLRLMLEKQLASEFSPLSLLRGDDEENDREIY